MNKQSYFLLLMTLPIFIFSQEDLTFRERLFLNYSNTSSIRARDSQLGILETDDEILSVVLGFFEKGPTAENCPFDVYKLIKVKYSSYGIKGGEYRVSMGIGSDYFRELRVRSVQEGDIYTIYLGKDQGRWLIEDLEKTN